MKILQIRQVDFNKKKYITSEIEMHRSLIKLGHETELWGIGDNNNKSEKFVRLFSAPLGRASLFQLKMMFFAANYALKNEIDLIIVDTLSVFSILGLIFIRNKKLKIFIDIRTIIVESKSKYLDSRFKISLRFAAKYFTGASFITEGTKSIIERKYGVSFKENIIWSSGVNIDTFNRKNSNSEELYKKYPELRDRFILFYHGSITENRGLDIVIDALNRVKGIIPKLMFVSLSNNNKYIKDYCKKKKYDLDNLFLIDAVDNYDVPKYINLADVCIVPLPRIIYWEVSSPLKLMEYLAVGKPLILSKITAHLDVLDDKSNEFCYYFEPEDSNSLDSALLSIYKNIKKASQDAIKGRNIIKNRYTWDKQAEHLIDSIFKFNRGI